MVDLPGSGETNNLDDAKQRAIEALLEAQRAVERIRPMRSMFGILGFSTAILEAAKAIQRATEALREVMLGNDDQLDSPPAQDRLANQVRGDGD